MSIPEKTKPAKTIVATDKAPAARGPYSQAVRARGLIFVAGQLAIDPASGQIMTTADIGAQTERTLRNIEAILEAAGSGLEQVIKTTVYLADMNEFAAMNAVYAKFFATGAPARATVEVQRLPLDMRVEIEAVALDPSA